MLALGVLVIEYVSGLILCESSLAVLSFDNSNNVFVAIIERIYVTHLFSLHAIFGWQIPNSPLVADKTFFTIIYPCKSSCKIKQGDSAQTYQSQNTIGNNECRYLPHK